MWRRGIAMRREHPWLGPDGVKGEYRDYAQADAAAAMGERAPVAGSIAAITGFLLAGTAKYNFGDSEVVMLAWVMVALPYVVARGGPVALVKGVP